MSTSFEVYEDGAGGFRWRGKAAENGRILAVSSESYVRREDAAHCLYRVLQATRNGCTVEYVDRPLNLDGLAEGVQPDDDETDREGAGC